MTAQEVSAIGEQLVRLQRRRAAVWAGARLENSAYRILWALTDGPHTLKQLAERLELDQSTINRQVHAALDAGHVERYDVPGDPSRHLRPTASGSAAYDHDNGVRAAVISAALAELGPERSARLIDDLRAFNDAWDAAT